MKREPLQVFVLMTQNIRSDADLETWVSVFPSRARALASVRRDYPHPSGPIRRGKFFEILRVPLDDPHVGTSWVYTANLKLIRVRHWPRRYGPSRKARRFDVGDIVRVPPSFLWPEEGLISSALYRERIGLVTAREDFVTLEESDGREIRLSGEYEVYFVTDRGFLRHCHAPESALSPFRGTLPSRDRFLKAYRAHVLGRRRIPGHTLKKIHTWRMRVAPPDVKPCWSEGTPRK